MDGVEGRGADVERGVGAVDAAAVDLAFVHEDAADGGFVGGEGEFGHVDCFAHEGFVVCAVGDGAEDHGDGCGVQVTFFRYARVTLRGCLCWVWFARAENERKSLTLIVCFTSTFQEGTRWHSLALRAPVSGCSLNVAITLRKTEVQSNELMNESRSLGVKILSSNVVFIIILPTYIQRNSILPLKKRT